MPKTLIAKNIAGIQNIAFSIDDAGKVTAINVACEVNFGEMGLSQTVDIWPSLTFAQKTAAQGFHNGLKAVITKQLID